MKDLHPCDESLFWYYISERHRIYLNREAGKPKPWSPDPIFQQYKFVNVFRELDRTTKWLIDNFLVPHKDDSPRTIAFNICWFRCFNRWETGELLGWQDSWDPGAVLEKLRKADFPVFTGAYIIHSEPGEAKDASMVSVASDLFHLCQNAPLDSIGPGSSMEAGWKGLQQVRHVGPFMAYQMVLDMMYVDSLYKEARDWDTWAYTGPGALRGLRRLDPGATMRDSLDRMLDLTDRSDSELAAIGADHVLLNPLSVHDIEFCLCELDKYCRVKHGEGRPRSSYPGT